MERLDVIHIPIVQILSDLDPRSQVTRGQRSLSI